VGEYQALAEHGSFSILWPLYLLIGALVIAKVLKIIAAIISRL
jgi:hypothetical protein